MRPKAPIDAERLGVSFDVECRIGRITADLEQPFDPLGLAGAVAADEQKQVEGSVDNPLHVQIQLFVGCHRDRIRRQA